MLQTLDVFSVIGNCMIKAEIDCIHSTDHNRSIVICYHASLLNAELDTDPAVQTVFISIITYGPRLSGVVSGIL